MTQRFGYREHARHYWLSLNGHEPGSNLCIYWLGLLVHPLVATFTSFADFLDTEGRQTTRRQTEIKKTYNAQTIYPS